MDKSLQEQKFARAFVQPIFHTVISEPENRTNGVGQTI